MVSPDPGWTPAVAVTGTRRAVVTLTPHRADQGQQVAYEFTWPPDRLDQRDPLTASALLTVCARAGVESAFDPRDMARKLWANLDARKAVILQV